MCFKIGTEKSGHGSKISNIFFLIGNCAKMCHSATRVIKRRIYGMFLCGTSLPQRAAYATKGGMNPQMNPHIKLRDYQQECINIIEECGMGRHLVQMATGLGKTVTFANIPRKGRMLILSHREEL